MHGSAESGATTRWFISNLRLILGGAGTPVASGLGLTFEFTLAARDET